MGTKQPTKAKGKPTKRKVKAERQPADPRPREAWDKRPTESAVAFEAFTEYRNFGVKRSLDKVAKKLGKSNQLMSRWSRQHEWVARSAAWDEAEYLRREDEDAQERKHGRIRERTNRRAFLNAMENKLKQAIEYVDLTDPDSVRAMIAMFDKVMLHSRHEFNDLATARTALTDPTGEKAYRPFDVTQMSERELEAALADFFGKVNAHPNGG